MHGEELTSCFNYSKPSFCGPNNEFGLSANGSRLADVPSLGFVAQGLTPRTITPVHRNRPGGCGRQTRRTIAIRSSAHLDRRMGPSEVRRGSHRSNVAGARDATPRPPIPSRANPTGAANERSERSAGDSRRARCGSRGTYRWEVRRPGNRAACRSSRIYGGGHVHPPMC
jgi:hypothetical protein